MIATRGLYCGIEKRVASGGVSRVTATRSIYREERVVERKKGGTEGGVEKFIAC